MADADQHPRPWQIVERRVIADRSPFGVVIDEDVRLPDGRLITNFMRIELRAFAIVFAVIDSADGARVPLVEQYRVGPRANSIELPAGFIEEGELPLEAAKRELREETGSEAEHWQALGRCFMDSSREAGWAHLFLATNAHQIMPPNHGDLGDQFLHVLPLADVQQLWREGTIRAAASVMTIGLALDWLHG